MDYFTILLTNTSDIVKQLNICNKINALNSTRRHSNDDIPHKMRLYGKISDRMEVDDMT